MFIFNLFFLLTIEQIFDQNNFKNVVFALFNLIFGTKMLLKVLGKHVSICSNPTCSIAKLGETADATS